MKHFRIPAFACLLLSLIFMPMHFVFAIEFSSVYALPTTALMSASANYKFFLTVDGSSSWVGGESMTITFPAGFQLSSFTEDDVDIADDGIDFTTAPTCGGSEQVGISVSGSTVTFEMCAGDGGSVASGSVIEIELGLNASSSGTGTRQITNPPNVGSYFISFTGTFGNGGSVIVPIVQSSGSGISVTVPSSSAGSSESGGSSGGSAPSRDDDDDDEDGGEDTDEDVIPDPLPPEEGDEGGEDTPSGEDISSGDAGSGEASEGTAGGGSPGGALSDEDSSGGEEGVPLSYEVGVSVDVLALPVVENTVEVLPYTTAILEILVEDGSTDAVFLEIGVDRHALLEVREGVWRGNVAVGLANQIGTIIFEQGGVVVATSPLRFDVLTSGMVYEVVEGRSVGVSDALVTVLLADGSVWNEGRFGQPSSRLTNSEGAGFSWYAPNGPYIVRVEKEGYAPVETRVTVTRNILAPTLFITRSGEIIEIPGDISEGGESPVGDEGIAPSSQDSSGQLTFFEEMRDLFVEITPQEVVVAAAPIVATAALVATAAVGGGQIWLLLYSFFSQPLLFFARKKRQKMGVVYNAVTKVPLDLVTVRAYDVSTQRLVKTVVTNQRGEFFLRLTKAGRYRLQAIKSGFVFPSTYLEGVREDGGYVDVYSGQEIEIQESAEPLAVSLPLDPQGSVTPAKVLRWERTRRRIALALSPLSVFVSLVAVFLMPGVLSFVLLGVQVILYVITWRVTHKKKAESWGIVYDERTRHPVGNVVIRLFEPKYNKLVESVLSDSRGRYVFALGPNEYYVTFEKGGYMDATVKPIDYRARKEVSLFGIHLPLRRRDEQSHG